MSARRRAQSGATSTVAVPIASILSATFRFRSLTDVDSISKIIASFYPAASSVIVGIRELMLNAVEHGNLGITYEEKTALIRTSCWEQEIEQRLRQPAHIGKEARALIERGQNALILTIEDEGVGFDWTRYLEIDPGRVRDPHGRGIALAQAADFDSLTYKAPGNKVVCTKQTY